jgi:phosphoribosylanthranilate isomerase
MRDAGRGTGNVRGDSGEMTRMDGRPHLYRPTPEAPWIKVCGVRTFADLEACARAGATHVGINAWPGSPRFVPPRVMAELIGAARSLRIAPVILHLPGSPLNLEEAAHLNAAFLQLLEPHSAALRQRLKEKGVLIIEARRATANTVSCLPWGSVLLLDAHIYGRPGGTGVTVSETLALAAPRPFVIAGGLTPESVADAIAACRPAGVDAASGLESRPGEKDPHKIHDFCAAAREALGRVRRGK